MKVSTERNYFWKKKNEKERNGMERKESEGGSERKDKERCNQ